MTMLYPALDTGIDFPESPSYLREKVITIRGGEAMKSMIVGAILCLAASALSQSVPTPPIPSVDIPQVSQVALANRVMHSSGHILGFVNIADFGISGRSYISLSDRSRTTPELSVGFMRLNPSYVSETFLNGYVYSQGLFILPAYLGFRYNILEDRFSTLDWSWYVRGGGGPAVGMLTPIGLGFFDSFEHTSFHLGVGAYAATGIEFVFGEQYSLFFQGGADYLGFARPVGDRSNFLGPSFSVGIGRLIP